MSMISIKKPLEVSTATTVALGLIGGWVTAKETGIRPLGGVILAAAGVWAGRSWVAKTNVATTAALSSLYLGGFGASHPLAKKIGAWPSVLTVTAAAAGAAYALSDSK
ncbi:hypothetical protein [Corynebacterium flavescens]|uniref:Membrane protein n=2 Tax=Corynebacterium flavescens TaxID=28028 RepID=A0A1L7CLI5_CORFL|nr:hypothetical protein [Corynebacterium flavescens]APT86658.1 membrane protein [Corynebacterium flavescens]KAA8722826.1 hypothetical protein F4V60_05200 [Corynebacterium flavescens]